MDWRNYQFWRKKLGRLEKSQTEFDLLIQRTSREIDIRKQLRRSIRLLEGPSTITKKVSGWRDKFRNAYDTGKSLFFRKKL